MKRLMRIEDIISEKEEELAFYEMFYHRDEHLEACIADLEAELDRLYEAARPDRDRIWRYHFE